MASDKIAFSVTEACISIGIGRSLFYELIARGHISAVKLGRRTLIKRDEIERFIATLPAAKIE